MKIEGPRPTGPAAPGRRASAPASGAGFALPTEQAAAPASASGVAPASSIDALLALQGYGDEPGRKRRQVARGRRTLDALDMLARAHLDGEAPHAARLALTALAAEREPSGDPGLDAVLAEIDLRAAVELAKLEIAAG